MALGQTLRYYRGQFNPDAAYQQGGGGGGDVISMYNPEVMNQFMGAVSQRQERFDAAQMMQAEATARIGETETYDIGELNNRIKSFESGINDLVKGKYNGDYSAAANEIAKMIGTERTNPFYHFNKQKVEMGKAYLDARMKLGSKFMSASSPFDVTFQDWQKGKTFEFTPINRDDIVKDAAMEFGTLADTIMSDPTLRSTAGGQYFLSTIQHGIENPAKLQEYLDGPDGQRMIQNIVDRNPELAKLPREQVLGAVFEGAHTAIGKTQTQYLQNQAFGPMLEAQLAGLEANAPRRGLVESGTVEAPKDKQEVLSSNLWGDVVNPIVAEEVKKVGLTGINTYDELVKYNKEQSRSPWGYENNMKARNAIKEVKQRIEDQVKNNNQMFAQQVYNINPFQGVENKDFARVTAQRKGMDEFINTYLASNALIGTSKDANRQLEGMTDKKITGIVLNKTGNDRNPVTFGFRILGTPAKGKSGKKPPEVEIMTTLDPSDENNTTTAINFFRQIDDRVMNTYLTELKKVNPEAFSEVIKAAGITDYDPEDTLK